jgi:hypothetical protein
LEKEGEVNALLVKGEELLIVAAGDTLEDSYRVDAIGQSAIEFTYLPLGVRQSMPIPPSDRTAQ